jgi:CheY-like chemotaxis protein
MRVETLDSSAMESIDADARVLVCDDEGRLADLTANLLRESGFLAETVTDGAAAVERARHEPSVDVLLLDLNLPGTSSRDVLGSLARESPHTRVILTSGYAIEDVPESLIHAANVAGYLAKPYSVERLIATIRAALAG